jgi:hypothetical protein
MGGMCRTCGRDWNYSAECGLWVLSNLVVFEVCKICIGLFKPFFIYHAGCLNLWKGAIQYYLPYHPDSNICRNIGLRSISYVALPLLTRNCKCVTAVCVLTNDRENVSVSLRDTGGTRSIMTYAVHSSVCEVQWRYAATLMLCKEMPTYLTIPHRIPGGLDLRSYIITGVCYSLCICCT